MIFYFFLSDAGFDDDEPYGDDEVDESAVNLRPGTVKKM